jgi:hypothetical protein
MLTSITVEGSTGPKFFAVEANFGVLFAIRVPVAAQTTELAPIMQTPKKREEKRLFLIIVPPAIKSTAG